MVKRIYVKPVRVQGRKMWGVFEMTRWEAFIDDWRVGWRVALWNLAHPHG